MAEFEIVIGSDNTKEVLEECHRRALVALELCGQQAERNAKIQIENSPRRVDTGLLRNSITHAMAGGAPAITSYKTNSVHGNTDSTVRRGIAGTPVKKTVTGTYSGEMPNVESNFGYSDQAVYIGTNVEYAIYVHEGTQRMAPNRFLRNAMGNHVAEYKKTIETVLQGGTGT